MPPKIKFVLPVIVAIVTAITIASLYFSPTDFRNIKNIPRSECGPSSGRLLVPKMSLDVPANWCWVSTVSEILEWHGLSHSSACELYDLVKESTVCEDAKSHELECISATQPPETCWRTKSGNAEPGAPEIAANRYRDKYGAISVEQRTNAPLSFKEIKEKICPTDSSEGDPFVYAYDNGNVNYHDVVVMGYTDLPPVAYSGSSIDTPQFGGTRFIKVHDPGNNLDPDVLDYDLMYAVEGIWEEEVFISKLREPSVPSNLRFWGR